MTSMVNITQGNMAPFPGGVLMKLNGQVIGSVGVSGASGDEDEYCALIAIHKLELGIESDPIEHSCTTVKDKNWDIL